MGIVGKNGGTIDNCVIFANKIANVFEITNPAATGTVSKTFSAGGTYQIILPTDENVVVTSNGTNYEGRLFINPGDTFTVSIKGENRKLFNP